MLEELRKDLMAEYFKVYESVTEFDRRLMTVKGWGVTLSLAALAWGFEKQRFGLFLVAALSGAGFWATEAVFKRHQMQTYVRMREIEVTCFELFAEGRPDGTMASSPQIDWTWFQAPKYFRGKLSGPVPKPERFKKTRSYDMAWGFANVVFPHVISLVAGTLLFLLGWFGKLGRLGIQP